MQSVLYIGGTGEISLACVQRAVQQGQHVTVFNRGQTKEPLPDGVELITGDMHDDDAYRALAGRGFDVVCQYLVFTPDQAERDAGVFAGHTGQYIFISSASCYQKPCRDHVITEDTPLENPFLTYSRNKADCERVLFEAHTAGRLPLTVVRPSHTHRAKFPGTFIPGDHTAWRMLQGKPILLHGNGQGLWTLTHADDYARAFVALCGNDQTLGEAYHITRDRAHTWDIIIGAIGAALGVEPTVIHASEDTLAHYRPDWADALRGDKGNSVVFDNAKVGDAVGGWSCEIGLEEGLRRAAEHVRARLDAGYAPDAEDDAMVDRIIDDLARLGA